MIELRDRLGLKTPTVSLATTQFLRSKEVEFPLIPAQVPSWLKNEFVDSIEFKPTYGVRWPHMVVGSDFDLLAAPLEPDRDFCDHVENTITVRSDGDVVPCCFDLTSKLVMGNVMTETLSNIWDGVPYQRLRESIAKRDFYSICRTCAVVKPPIYLIPRAVNKTVTFKLIISFDSSNIGLINNFSL